MRVETVQHGQITCPVSVVVEMSVIRVSEMSLNSEGSSDIVVKY